MKKTFLSIALFGAMLAMSSCGGGSKTTETAEGSADVEAVAEDNEQASEGAIPTGPIEYDEKVKALKGITEDNVEQTARQLFGLNPKLDDSWSRFEGQSPNGRKNLHIGYNVPGDFDKDVLTKQVIEAVINASERGLCITGSYDDVLTDNPANFTKSADDFAAKVQGYGDSAVPYNEIRMTYSYRETRMSVWVYITTETKAVEYRFSY